MKTFFKLFAILLILLTIVGCNSIDETEVTDIYALFENKVFYNTYDASGYESYSNVVFNKDKTFKINDINNEGSYIFEGTFLIEGDVVILTVDKSDIVGLKEIRFAVVKDNVINLETDLSVSKMFDTFICCDLKEMAEVIEKEREFTESIIAGKIFHNVVDRFDCPIHSFIGLYKNGTFLMRENTLEGYCELEGTWEANGYKVNCKAEKSSYEDINEIVFYVRDFEKLVLETDLAGSIDGDEFITRIIETDNSVDSLFGHYMNVSQLEAGAFGCSTLDLKEDGTFTYVEVCGMGAVEINGIFSREGDILMFSNFDSELYDYNGDSVYNFEFKIISDGTIELMRDLECSIQGNYFCTEYDFNSVLSEYTVAKYLHENIPDLSKDLYPVLELKNDGSFVFSENCYDGMHEYKGAYTRQGTLYLMTVTDKSELEGYQGYDVDQIVFELFNDGLYLRTNLCMSRKGDEFYLQ